MLRWWGPSLGNRGECEGVVVRSLPDCFACCSRCLNATAGWGLGTCPGFRRMERSWTMAEETHGIMIWSSIWVAVYCFFPWCYIEGIRFSAGFLGVGKLAVDRCQASSAALSTA